MKKAAIFMGIGFELVGLILGAWVIGRVVDNYFHWNGYGVATFVVVVMLGWMYHLIVLLKKFMDDVDDDASGNGDSGGNKKG
jgi:hypothetical protein